MKAFDMSKLRSVCTSFWNDPFIEDLSPNEKLLFLYLITNDKTNMLGIYEVSLKKISYDTGLNIETIKKAFESFESLSKVKYINNHIIVINFLKHQNYNTNMKKSAIDVYNSLPKELKIKNLEISKENPFEGFETLFNHLVMVSKEEIEIEIEIESEIESEIEIEKSEIEISHPSFFDSEKEISEQELLKKQEEERRKKVPQKKEEVVFPFQTEKFLEYWQAWKHYKDKEHKFKYKTIESEQAALKKLSELSGYDENKAIKIIENSMANGWKGFFELKKESDARESKSNQQIFNEAMDSEIARNFRFK